MTPTPIKADTLEWRARNFRRLYADQSLSQVTIAPKVKMNRPYLNAIKNKKQDPRIAHALKVPVTELLERG